jgi:hypothetical protein
VRGGAVRGGEHGAGLAQAIRVPLPMLAAIDALGDGRLDRPDRSALLRECLAIGIEVMQKRKGTK